jgi:hypothetical protein
MIEGFSALVFLLAYIACRVLGSCRWFNQLGGIEE